jgi:predicted esterase
MHARDVVSQWRPVSDKYGMILLAPESQDNWQRPRQQEDRHNVDAAMREVLQKYAIDTSRIALIGYSASGGGAVALGGFRPDLFSRIVLGSTDFYIKNVDPRSHTTHFLVTGGIEESVRSLFTQVQALRHDGHPVQEVLGIRDHSSNPEDWDYIGRWLMDSWTPATPKGRAAAPQGAPPPVLLTADALDKVTRFWKSFRAEPDSIRTTARLDHLVEIVLAIGTERPTTMLADMPALAAKYPSIAADLEAAGLTARQFQSYRLALISARAAELAVYGTIINGPHRSFPGVPDISTARDSLDRLDATGEPPITISATSVEGKNMAFLAAHREQIKALADLDWWIIP